MKLTTSISVLVLMVVLACSGDDATSPDAGSADAGVAECVPDTQTPAGQLVNAPVESDVEVVEKTPQHPGAPGPNGLP